HARMRWVAGLPERRGYGASPGLRTRWIVPRVVLVRASSYQGEAGAQLVGPLPLSDAEPADRSLSYGLELEESAPHHTIGSDSQLNVHVDVDVRSSVGEENTESLGIAGSDIGSSASIHSLDCPENDDAANDSDVLSEHAYSNAGPEDEPQYADSAIGSCDDLECAYPTNAPDGFPEYEGSIAGSYYEHATVGSEDGLPSEDSNAELGCCPEEEEAGVESDDGFVPNVPVLESVDSADLVDAKAETAGYSGSEDSDNISFDVFLDALQEELEEVEESIAMVESSPAITEDEREYALGILEQREAELTRQREEAMEESPGAFENAMSKRMRMIELADAHYEEKLKRSAFEAWRIRSIIRNVKIENADAFYQGDLVYQCFSHLRAVAQARLDKRQGEAN
ncbi:hypothetical protein H4R20_005064, partial [Coemansia guatemalensis]